MNQSHVWHLTHINNLSKILVNGILCLNEVCALGHTDISDRDVQHRRAQRVIYNNKTVHDFAPTFWVQRNPMMYKLFKEGKYQDLIWLKINIHKIQRLCLTADGNAACVNTRFYPGVAQDRLPWEVLTAPSWKSYIDGCRQRAAELLVLGAISPQAIDAIEVPNFETANMCRQLTNLHVSLNPYKFFC